MAIMNDVKAKNMLNVIKALCNNGPISKPDIARILGLTTPSVHNFMNELLANGVAVEEGVAESNGGRKATIYNINPDCGYLVGLSIHHTKLRTTVYNIKMQQLYHEYRPISPEYTAKTQHIIRSEIERALECTGIPKAKCFGIGVSVPGLVEYDTGVIRNIPYMPNWNGVPLKSYLEDRIGLPTLVENDVNALALVGKWVQGFSESDLAVLSVFRGVGAGIITNGAVFRGANDAAGEIGHTTICFDGIPCKCGNRGCIDAYVRQKEDILIQMVEEATGQNIEELGHDKISDFLRKSSPEVQKLSADMAYFVGIAIDHIIKSYSPRTVVVYCDWLDWDPDLRYRIIEDVNAKNRWLQKNKMQIRFYSPGQSFPYAGAVQVLDKIFSDEERICFLPA